MNTRGYSQFGDIVIANFDKETRIAVMGTIQFVSGESPRLAVGCHEARVLCNMLELQLFMSSARDWRRISQTSASLRCQCDSHFVSPPNLALAVTVVLHVVGASVVVWRSAGLHVASPWRC